MTIPTLRGPGELIAAIPQLLGQVPDECVVVVGVADRGEMMVVIRVERERLLLPDLGEATAADIARTMRKEGARRALLVSWTHKRIDVECPAAAVARDCLASVCEIADVWATDGAQFWSPGCADSECCPVGGRPVPAATALEAGVPRVAAVHRRGTLGTAETARQRRNAARAAQRWLARRDAGRETWCLGTWTHVEESMGVEVSPPTWGKVIAGLTDVRVRDALIVRWLGAGDDVIYDTLVGNITARVNAAMDGALRPGGARVPCDEEMSRALLWCDRLTGMMRASDVAVVLTLKALLWWWIGNVDECRVHVREALDVDDSYTLALLLGQMCEAGLQPGWMRQ